MFSFPPIAAESLFYINGFPVTNSYLNSSITVIGFLIFAYFVKLSIKKYEDYKAPRGLANFSEFIVEFMLGNLDGVTHDRKKSLKFLPFVGSLFLFILVSNWIGLMPGTGSIGFHEVKHGVSEFIPLFRPANTDLNMTLAMAVLGIFVSHALGIVTIGFFKYANKFIKIGDLVKAIKTFNPVKILVACIEFIVGFIEIFSEIAKMASLSLRLFGNIFAGEVLLTVLASIMAYILPLPFMALELLVGFIQATVFSLLVSVYLTVSTSEISSHEEHETKEHVESKNLSPVI